MLMQVGNSPSSFLKLDKDILSIDFGALNLLQAILFTQPSQNLIIELKQKFGIFHLNPIEVQRELRSVYSPLRRYLTSMMMSLVHQSRLLLAENFQAFLMRQRKQRIRKVLGLLMSLRRKNHKGRSWMWALKRRLRILNELALYCLSKVQPREFEHVRLLLIEAHRYDLLKLCLQYADFRLAPVIAEVVGSHIRMLNNNFHRYEELIQNNDLNLFQLTHLQEWLVLIMKQIEAVKPEEINSMFKQITVPRSVCLKQYLLRRLTIDLMAFRYLERVEVKVSSYLNNQPHDHNQLQNPIDSLESVVEISSANHPLEYEVLLKKLNDYFIEIIVDNKGVIIYEADAILAFLDMVLQVTQRRHLSPQYLNELRIKAIYLIEKLSTVQEVDYTPLLNCLMQMYYPPINLSPFTRNDESDPLIY